jgi:hypothetical protein
MQHLRLTEVHGAVLHGKPKVARMPTPPPKNPYILQNCTHKSMLQDSIAESDESSLNPHTFKTHFNITSHL